MTVNEIDTNKVWYVKNIEFNKAIKESKLSSEEIYDGIMKYFNVVRCDKIDNYSNIHSREISSEEGDLIFINSEVFGPYMAYFENIKNNKRINDGDLELKLIFPNKDPKRDKRLIDEINGWVDIIFGCEEALR